MAPKRAALIVIDGWGERAEEYGNAIMQAATPVMDGFKTSANFAVIEASGLAVGLPEGTMGNSEVGHLTIGAGAVDYQDLVRINLAVKDGSIAKQAALVDAFAAAKSGTGRLHLFGLLSDGGVHSHQEHLYALIASAKEAGVKRTLLHLCMDGRDTPPTSGAGYVEALEKKLAEIGHGEISTIAGRYYAMDRDKRWERVQKAYDVMCREDGACETVAAGGVKELVEVRVCLDASIARGARGAERARDERSPPAAAHPTPRRPSIRPTRRMSSSFPPAWCLTAALPTATSSSASTSARTARARCSSASRPSPSLRRRARARRRCASR